jgi:hypothetical protein
MSQPGISDSMTAGQEQCLGVEKSALQPAVICLSADMMPRLVAVELRRLYSPKLIEKLIVLLDKAARGGDT